MTMKTRRFLSTLILTAGLLFGIGAQAAGLPTVHLFWADGCPHCADEKAYLPDLIRRFPGLEIRTYEVSSDPASADLFRRVGEELGVNLAGVPVTVVGRRYVLGFRDAATSGQAIESMLQQVIASGEPDLVGSLTGSASAVETPVEPQAVQMLTRPGPQMIDPGPPPEPESGAASPEPDNDATPPGSASPEETPRNGGLGVPEEVRLPLLGTVRLAEASLPVFTIVLALLDGFNPCAMWVLLFLLSLLVGIPDRKRAWILGASFVAASSLVYFLFLAAWLHVFLFLGFIFWVRLAVGLVALAAGGYYLYDFIVNKRGGCGIVSDSLREKIFARTRAAVSRGSLVLGIAGIVTLAFAVNLIELVCSAGLPAVYTQVLALNHLPGWQYYAYLILYILVFLADDLFIFFTAMLFLQLTGIQHKYTRCARLAGGLLMLAVGLLLLFKPEWLTFG